MFTTAAALVAAGALAFALWDRRARPAPLSTRAVEP
jgi:hypothetical protein